MYNVPAYVWTPDIFFLISQIDCFNVQKCEASKSNIEGDNAPSQLTVSLSFPMDTTAAMGSTVSGRGGSSLLASY